MLKQTPALLRLAEDLHLRGDYSRKIDALRRELSWMYYRTLLRVDDEAVRQCGI